MIKTGLLSITFRKLQIREIVNLVSKGQLDAIEWGGDIHVPHGNLETARETATMCRDKNIAIASYGSYYKAGLSEAEGLSFNAVLDSALELNAPVIRVWAGNKNMEDADAVYKKQVIDDLKRIGETAKRQNIKISLEFHGNTLTNTNEAALELSKELAGSNVYFYWQPPVGKDENYCADGLSKLLPLVTNVHVFHWLKTGDQLQRLPLSLGEKHWERYFKILASSGNEHFAMLEFVKNDSTEQFLDDAAALKKFVRV